MLQMVRGVTHLNTIVRKCQKTGTAKEYFMRLLGKPTVNTFFVKSLAKLVWSVRVAGSFASRTVHATVKMDVVGTLATVTNPLKKL